jgi:hypothetical protein
VTSIQKSTIGKMLEKLVFEFRIFHLPFENEYYITGENIWFPDLERFAKYMVTLKYILYCPVWEFFKALLMGCKTTFLWGGGGYFFLWYEVSVFLELPI